MKRLLTSAALVWAGAAVMLAQAGRSTPGQSAPPRSGPTVSRAEPAAPVSQASPVRPGSGATVSKVEPSPTQAAEAAKYRVWLNKNCVGCHNSRTASPADAPVNLESANLDDVLPQAEIWERVLRKLSARAMPPQGMPHPAEADYVGFTSWLAGSLDRAWEGRSTPGRYVVHRLNRSEYANVVRDLLSVDVDVTELLPSDGANYGFDNIAASLKTSPLLLERYVAAAQKISALAVGDPDARPGTAEYTLSRELSQDRKSTRLNSSH